MKDLKDRRVQFTDIERRRVVKALQDVSVALEAGADDPAMDKAFAELGKSLVAYIVMTDASIEAMLEVPK